MPTSQGQELKKSIDRASKVIRPLQKFQPPGPSPASHAEQVRSAIALLKAVVNDLPEVEPFLYCVPLTPELREWALKNINEEELADGLADARRMKGPTLRELIEELEHGPRCLFAS